MRNSTGVALSRSRGPFSRRSLCGMAPQRPEGVVAALGGGGKGGDTVDLDALTRACAALVSRAGGRIRAVHAKRAAGAKLHVVYKDASDSRSALTEADHAAQAAIVPALRRHFPRITVIGEEDDGECDAHDPDPADLAVPLADAEAHTALGTARAPDVVVHIDPLDGTKEFVRGNLPAVQTLAGVSVRGRPVSGVIGLPFAPGAPVLVAARPSGVSGLDSLPAGAARLGEGVVLAASSGAVGVVDAVQRVVGAAHTLALGGAGNKMLRVATGEADIAVLNLCTSLWDTAATEALVVAGGGTVTDFFGARIAHVDAAPYTNFCGVIATGPRFAERDARGRTHALLCADIRAAMAADALLARVGFTPGGVPQATDVARDLDGNLLTVDFLRRAVAPRITGFAAPERSAVRYLMSEACRLELHAADGCDAGNERPPKSVFLKRVVMEDLPHVQLKMRTAPAKLARDVTSYQVEAAFLGSRACARLVAAGVHVARPYFVDQRPAPEGAPPIQSRFLLVLEDFATRDGWRQYGLLDAAQTRACLAALAEMHAFFWSFGDDPDAPELDAAVWPQASYWVPARQAVDSFEKLPRCWARHLQSFSVPIAQARVEDARREFPLARLGEVLQRHAERVAMRVHSVGTDLSNRCRTIVHGDAKAANFFLREGEGNGGAWEVGLIDFQWAGWGHPGLDVAYLVATSAAANVLSKDGGAERDFIEFYHRRLVDGFLRFAKAGNRAEAEQLLPIGELCAFYDEAFIDLSRLVVGYHWDRIKASPEVLVSRKDNIGSNSYNKDVDCAVWFIERTYRLLSNLEAAKTTVV